MDEKLDKLLQNIDDLTTAVARGFAGIEERMATKVELAETEKRLEAKINVLEQKVDTGTERVEAKIDGLQRSMDGAYERQGALEARVSKVEAELHL